MLDLVGHFGDQEDSHKPCGHCDICDPDHCIAQQQREPTGAEADALNAILVALKQRDAQATGRLFRELFEDSAIDRKRFDRLLGGLARAGFIGVYEDSFEKDGRVIEYRRVSLTHEGRTHEGSVARHVRVEADAPKAPKKTKSLFGKKKGKASQSAKSSKTVVPGAADMALAEALKLWRLAEARRRRTPACNSGPTG